MKIKHSYRHHGERRLPCVFRQCNISVACMVDITSTRQTTIHPDQTNNKSAKFRQGANCKNNICNLLCLTKNRMYSEQNTTPDFERIF